MSPANPTLTEIDRIIDEFADRHNRGEQPRIEDYLHQYPQFAADLKGILPLIGALSPLECAPSRLLNGTTVVNPTVDTPEGRLPQVPGFSLIQELGRGGMGVVYLARQEKLNRLVAFKTILAGAHAGTESRLRFLAEAEAVARLQHPGIVQVYEFGTQNGQPYFALEYLSGGGLNDRLQAGPLQARAAAQLVEQLARAVDVAHKAGIVHRDLKPANVLFAADGTPKVTDFGLAKFGTSDSGLTATGAIMGTPSYMAPEQAGEAKDAGPLADVYALGAILYECLTGRPPFKGASVFDTIDLVRTQEPVSVRELQPSVPLDLETICLKCLQKPPTKRYASANALADDLQRFVAGHPVLARPVGAVERGWRWTQRNPVVAGLLGGIAAILMAVSAGSIVAAVQFRSSQVRAESAETGEREKRIEADENLKRAVAAEEDSGKKRIAAEASEREAERRLVASLLDQTRATRIAREQGQRFDGLERIAEAARIARKLNDPIQIDRLRDEAVACLALPDWKPVEHRLPVPRNSVFAFDRELKQYVRAEVPLSLTIRRTVDDQIVSSVLWPNEYPLVLQFRPSGDRLLASSGDSLMVWETISGKRMYSNTQQKRKATGHTLDPKGTTVVVARDDFAIDAFKLDSKVKLWSFPTRGIPNLASFNHDGRYLAVSSAEEGLSVGRPYWIQIFDLLGKRMIREWSVAGVVENFAWHPSLNYLLVRRIPRTRVEVWKPLLGELHATLPDHDSSIKSVAFSPEGTEIVTSTDTSTVIWDFATLQPLTKCVGTTYVAVNSTKLAGSHPGETGYHIGELALPRHCQTHTRIDSKDILRGAISSPDGRWIAVTSNQQVAIYSMEGTVAATINVQLRPVAWHPHRPEFVGIASDGISIWKYEIKGSKLEFHLEKVIAWSEANKFYTSDIIWLEGGKQVAIYNSSGQQLFTDDWQPIGPLQTRTTQKLASRLTSTGKFVELISEDLSLPFFQGQQAPYRLRVVDLQGHPLGTTVAADKQIIVDPILISPCGRWVAFATIKKISVWEIDHLDRPPYEIQNLGTYSEHHPVAFHPDSRTIAVFTSPAKIELHDLEKRTRLVTLTNPTTEPIDRVLFTSDGERLVAFEANCFRCWNLRSLRGELDRLGLDWDAAAMPPPAPSGPPVTAITFRGMPIKTPPGRIEIAPAPRRLR